jgi:hypothetical protein
VTGPTPPPEPAPVRRVPGPLVVLLMALFVGTVVWVIYRVAAGVAGPGQLERGRPTYEQPEKK